MDKRFKKLTTAEELLERKKLSEELALNPHLPIPTVIRKIRTALRLTTVEYAKLCGVSEGTLSKLERDETSPTLATVNKLLKPIGMGVGAIFLNKNR